MSCIEPTVFVVDDDQLVRTSLQELAESVSLKVRAFASAQEFLESYEPEASGCLVLDVRMPGMSGTKLQDELHQRESDLPIIFITGHGDIPMAVEALRKGAFDFVEKPIRGQLLLDKINSAIEQDRQLYHRRARERQIRTRLAMLTDRENDVLDHLKAGFSTKVIARTLGVSRKTVDYHMSSIREKMGVESTPQVAMLLHEIGLLPSPHVPSE